MKKMIALATVLAATAVNAEELKFGDINYFLKQGQINAALDLNQTYEKETVLGQAYTTRSYLVKTNFGYAINDQMNVTLGLDYAYDRQTKDRPDEVNHDIHSDGLSTPAVGFNYRLMNQNDARYNLDFGAVARINFQDAEAGTSSPTDDKDGNYTDPSNSLELNARMGRKWNEANEWQLAAGLQYFMDGEYTINNVNGSDQDVDKDGYSNLFLRASYQYRPVHEFMVLVSLQGTMVGEQEGKNKDTGAEFTYDRHLDVDFNFVAKYLITENFIAKFNYGQSRNSDYDVEVGAIDDEVRKRRENFYGLGVEFLF